MEPLAAQEFYFQNFTLRIAKYFGMQLKLEAGMKSVLIFCTKTRYVHCRALRLATATAD